MDEDHRWHRVVAATQTGRWEEDIPGGDAGELLHPRSGCFWLIMVAMVLAFAFFVIARIW